MLMIKVKSKKIRYLIIGIIGFCIGLAMWFIYSLLTRPKAVVKPTLTSVTVTITHPDGKPLADTSLNITNFGYAWSGRTDKNGAATVPPQAISPPVRVCALNDPRTSNVKCDYSASIDESGKALDPADSLVVSLHSNFVK